MTKTKLQLMTLLNEKLLSPEKLVEIKGGYPPSNVVDNLRCKFTINSKTCNGCWFTGNDDGVW